MPDYRRYKTETLTKMLGKAEEKYRQETEKPIGNWGDGMRLSKLPSITAWERAKNRVEEIKKELERRGESV